MNILKKIIKNLRKIISTTLVVFLIILVIFGVTVFVRHGLGKATNWISAKFKGENHEDNKETVVQRVVPKRKPSAKNLFDHCWFPDHLMGVFSFQDKVKCYFSDYYSDIRTRSRLFFVKPDLKEKRMINLEEMNKEIARDISSEDHIAPLISPNGRMLIFAVSRRDHLSSLYLIDLEEKELKRLASFHDSIAFSWLSDREIFFWTSYFSDVDLSQTENYNRYGESSIVNIEGQRKKLACPSKEFLENLRVKYVSYSTVQMIP